MDNTNVGELSGISSDGQGTVILDGVWHSTGTWPVRATEDKSSENYDSDGH